MSADYETKVRVNKKELLSCIDRATLLIRENDKKPVIIQISDGEMLLKLTSGFGSMKEEILIEKEGKDILHFTLSGGISGSVNSANIAKTQMEEKYPERKIIVIDSLAASSGFGMLVDAALDKQEEGLSLEENAAWAEENKNKLHHWFFSTDLTSFIRGGRISKVSGFVGQALNICPLMNVNAEGKLIPRNKYRGKKQVIREMVKRMEEHAQGGLSYNGKCFMSCSACEEDARKVADMIEEKFPNLNGKVRINSIGTVIGAHTGPGTVALFFWGDEREI